MVPEGNNIVCRHGRVWLAGQPEEADIRAWADAGAKLVVNSRTPEETAQLPFDMAATVAGCGMKYVEMPIGGPYGANPIHTAELDHLLETEPGHAVLHCRTGTRSAHLYAAHLLATGQAGGNPFQTMGWPGPADPSMVQALIPANSA